MREWLGNVLAFDSRALRTLKPLVLRPGQLTVSYLAGRRVRYVPPLRLYLFLSVLLFLALAWTDYSAVQVNDGGDRDDLSIVSVGTPTDPAPGSGSSPDGAPPGTLLPDELKPGETPQTTSLAEAFMDVLFEPFMDRPEVINRAYRDRLAQCLFLLVPVFALYLNLLHRWPRRPYIHHLIFSLHLHSFVFFITLLATAADRLLGAGGLAAGLVPIWTVAYLFLAMRRVYGAGLFLTLAKQGLLLFVHGLTMSFALLVTLMVTLLLMV